MENWQPIQSLVDSIIANLQHIEEKTQKQKINLALCKVDAIVSLTTNLEEK